MTMDKTSVEYELLYQDIIKVGEYIIQKSIMQKLNKIWIQK